MPSNATTFTLPSIALSAGEAVDLAIFPDSNGLGTFVETDLSIDLMPIVPVLTAVAETPTTGDLNAGKTVTIALGTSAAVTVTGTPTLTLNDNGIAVYDAAKSTSTSLVFDYTVGTSDIDVASLAVTQVNLPNGATIQDGGGNNTNLSLFGFPQNGPQIDTDTNEQAALSLTVNGGAPIGAAAASAVPFAIVGLEADDSGAVAFSDGRHAPVVINIVNGVPVVSTANLSGLTDGPVTATLHLNTDAAGNSFTDVVASATLDQDTNDHPVVTLTGLTGGNAVEGTALTATVAVDDLPSSGITYAWQVSHDGGTSWTPISGATSDSFTPREPDEGGQLQAQVSFTDLAGNNETGTATVLRVVDAFPTLSVSVSSYTTLDDPFTTSPHYGTFAQGINDGSQVAGYYYDGSGNAHGFLYGGGSYGTLDFQPGTNQTFPEGINNAGQIVGWYNDRNSDHGFLYKNGSYTPLNDPLATVSYGTFARGINATGEIIGYYQNAPGGGLLVDHGFFLVGGNYTTLDDPLAGGTANGTAALGVNDSDQIVGYYYDGSGTAHGFLYSGGNYTTLDDPSGVDGTFATAINDAGQIVGYYFDNLHEQHGFLYSGGVYTTFDDPLGTSGTYAYGLNNNGQIVGVYLDGSATHGFLAASAGPTGTVVEGSILSATPTTNDADATVTYQWQSLSGAAWTNISGATGLTYQVSESDEGRQVRVVATSADSGGSTSATSTPTSAVVDVPPTLSVSVSGNAVEGSILTATPTLGTDSDNATSDVTYQWERNGTAIGGATGSTYVVGEADEGAQITVVASFNDDTGQSVQATSTPTGTVLDAPPTVTTPTIAGTAQEGVTLTASASAGQTDNTVTYQWFTSADGYTNPIGSGATYQVQEGDESHQIEAVATTTNDNGVTVSATSTPTGLVVDATPTLSVSISSNAMATYSYTLLEFPGAINVSACSINDFGQIVGGYVDSSGKQHGFLESGGIYTTIDFPGSTFSVPTSIDDAGEIIGDYQDSTGIDHGFIYSAGNYTTIDPPGGVDTIPNSVNASGQIAGFYIGNGTDHGFLYSGGAYNTIDPPGSTDTVVYSINASGQITGYYQDRSGVHGFVDSAGTFSTLDVPGAAQTIAYSINDLGQIAGYYQDSSGHNHGLLENGGIYTTIDFPGSTYTIAYSINDPGQIVGIYLDGSGQEHSFVDIAGAYTTIDPPVSLSTTVQVQPSQAVNASGQIVGTYSDGSGVHGFLATANPVTHTNAVQEGQTLMATGIANSGDAVISYQWQVLNGSTWANINGATKSTYSVTEANENHQLRVIATSSDVDGGGTSATSIPTASVTDVPPTLSVAVNGIARQGQVLTATANATGDGDGGNTTYQWQDLVGSNWVAITGATHSTYTVAEAVEGLQIRVLATFTDDTAQTVSATSLPTTPVLDVTPTLSVTVSGTAQEGQKLTAHPIVTSDGDGGATTYQWQKLVGTTWTNITGATASTYQVAELDEGYQVRVAATFTDDTGQTASATSATTASVIDITPTLSVTVSGVAQEGQTLMAAAIANDYDAIVSFQWQQLIGGTWTNISGATGSTYAVTEAKEGSRLRAVATSSDSDGSGTSATSASTASVVDPPPTLTIPNLSLFVAAGGSVSLPISVSGFDSDDKVSVKIAGLPTFETITDNLDRKSFSGSSVTLTAAEVNSGLTLHSSYGGTGQPVNVLTVTAANTTAGEAATSAAQTITVTDPPVPSTLAGAQDHNGTLQNSVLNLVDQRVALLGQYMASTFTTSGAGAILAADPMATTPQHVLLAQPQHLGAG